MLMLTVACNGDGLVCILLPDPTGLTVELSARPEGPYTVQVVPSSSSPVSYTYQCDGGPSCRANRIFFPGLVAPLVTIRVTTSLGTRTTSPRRIEYQESYPNGKGCDPRAFTASVQAEIP